jgi:hypothetical protein
MQKPLGRVDPAALYEFWNAMSPVGTNVSNCFSAHPFGLSLKTKLRAR